MAQWLTRATEERNVAGSTPHVGTDFCIPPIAPTRMSEDKEDMSSGPLPHTHIGGPRRPRQVESFCISKAIEVINITPKIRMIVDQKYGILGQI
jgi:hypothetical protein